MIDVKIGKNLLSRQGLLAKLALLVGTAAHANPAERGFAQTLLRLNRSAVLEPAGAHSRQRLNVGAGMRLIPLPAEAAPTVASEFQLAEQEPSALWAPQVWLSKGLFYPMDVGVSFSPPGSRGISQGGAYLQWTVYEEFARPAVAGRLTFARSYGLPSAEARALGLEFVSSWGYGIASLYGGLALELHGLTRADREESRSELIRSLGVHVQVSPAVVYAVVDASWDSAGLGGITGKLSVEI